MRKKSNALVSRPASSARRPECTTVYLGRCDLLEGNIISKWNTIWYIILANSAYKQGNVPKSSFREREMNGNRDNGFESRNLEQWAMIRRWRLLCAKHAAVQG